MQKKYFMTLALSLVVSLISASALAQSWEQTQTSTDEDLLIQAIVDKGDSPEDIHNVNVACKRLSIYGTPKAIPALVALLSNEKQNFNGRFALEAMPFDEADAALLQAAQDLTGVCRVGVIDSLGVRGKDAAVPVLMQIAKDDADPAVQKAVYIALSAIASADAQTALLAKAQEDLSALPFENQRALADSVLALAQKREEQGQLADAVTLYLSVAQNETFPLFTRKAGLYRSLLCQREDAIPTVVAILKGETYPLNGAQPKDAFNVALKTVREFPREVGAKLIAAICDAFNDLPAENQPIVLRAFGAFWGDGMPTAPAEILAKAAQKNDEPMLQLAAVLAATDQGTPTFVEVPFEAWAKSDELRSAYLKYAALYAGKLEKYAPDQYAKFCQELTDALASNLDDDQLLFLVNVAEESRIKQTADNLVKIASTRQGKLRDAALAALAEIVELDDLELLVNALNGETDDKKVDWILRAACTRMPREECAAKVAELFATADVDAQNKMLPLLKQIGGQTALNAVANACNGATIDKATQILGEWNTPEDAEAVAKVCLTIAQQAQDAKYHSRGVRGYIRIARQFDLPVATKIAMCQTAFEVARRPEDKKLIFEVFKRNIIADNVGAALEYVKYDEFKEDACEAAVFVAEKIHVSQPDWNWNEPTDDQNKANAAKILVDGMKKVVETTGNADLKARAQKLL